MRVLFIARRSRNNPDMATAIIYYRVKLDSIVSNDRSTFISVNWLDWESLQQRIKGESVEAEDNNLRLSMIRSDITRLFMLIQQEGQPLSAQQLADRYAARQLPATTPKPEPPKPKGALLVKLLLEYENTCHRDYTGRTLQFYQTRILHFREFAQVEQILQQPVADLDLIHGSRFIEHLKGLKYDRQYIIRHLQVIKAIGSLAVINRHIKLNPFTELKMKKREKRDTTHLENDHLTALTDTQWRPVLQRIVDLFLFSCYTGLHYGDAQTLQQNDVRPGIDGRQWLFKMRGKYADSPFFDQIAEQKMPLCPQALALIEKYGGAHCLPKISNAKYNEALKQIAFLIGFEKRLTVKIARKTFTDRMLNEFGFTEESVAVMLGHASTKHIGFYSKADERRVSKEVHYPNEPGL